MEEVFQVRFRASTEERLTAAEKLRTALELADLAEQMVRARMLRERPGASESEIEARIQAWYAERPGAEHGDGSGIPCPWPRRHAP